MVSDVYGGGRLELQLNSIFRAGPESKFDDNLPLDPPKSQTTYDELRQRNRNEFQQKKASPYYR